MKQFFKILFACLCAFILFFFVVFVFFIAISASMSSGDDDKEVQTNSVLYLDMNDVIEEQGQDDGILSFGGTGADIVGLNDILHAIKEAKNDDKIKGIYIKTGLSMNGWSTLQEIRMALEDFKLSKKFVLAYGELIDQKSYYVASVSDKVYLNPSGLLEFKGLSITGTFYKGALDKLGVTSEAFHCGKYKGSFEPYKLDKYSEPNRLQLSVLLNDFYSEFLRAVSSKTKIDTANLAKMANEGAVKFPAQALANKFVDALIFSDSVESMIKTKLSIKEKDKIKFVDPTDYAKTIKKSFKGKDKIAILYASGEIHDGEGSEGIYSKNITKDIRKIANDESVKAVVLRINSPGGSALASEIIYHELMNLKLKKPIIVSMNNYAASGGYYMACAGDSLFAEPNTIVGSIGVLGVMFNVGNMMKDKLGVTFDNIKTGEYADFPNMTRQMTDMERNWIQSYLDTTYMQFKTRVSSARKMTMEQVEEIAQGHVYSGRLGKEIKLVDEIGNTERALQSAAKLAKLKDFKVVEYPKSIDKFEELISSITGSKKEEAAIKKLLGEDYKVYKEIQKVRSQKNSIQAILPIDIDIK